MSATSFPFISSTSSSSSSSSGLAPTPTYNCPVCFEPLSTVRPPLVLTCGHSFCCSCLSVVSVNQEVSLVDDERRVIECPTCRKRSPVPPEGITGLPKNFALLDILGGDTQLISLKKREQPESLKRKLQVALGGNENQNENIANKQGGREVKKRRSVRLAAKTEKTETSSKSSGTKTAKQEKEEPIQNNGKKRLLYEMGEVDSPDLKQFFESYKEKYRPVLVEWIADVCLDHHSPSFPLLHRTATILDQYMLNVSKPIPKDKLQLVGVVCIMIASGIEGGGAPVSPSMAASWCQPLATFAAYCDGCYKHHQLKQMEVHLRGCKFLDFSAPTLFTLFSSLSDALNFDSPTLSMTEFILSISVITTDIMEYAPATIVASAIWLVKNVHSGGEECVIWTERLETMTGLKEDDLLHCVGRMVSRLQDEGNIIESGLYKAEDATPENSHSVTFAYYLPEHCVVAPVLLGWAMKQ
eukprot:CAMPEP_0201540844 /NCGR_PEP_ID=MMETSP0161_2-20130828/71159_1 /ASSEMBLY_ACC=CAM_ASM_000251 /TAXON_ID=180227 /ORGANISM="Neoparamoeba aestuarina, Strain SoJaBio B1-5/56/2" /LENGTH=468 /DNA_ID=CAMNT_0047948341 /DNA_START=1142 /DNA_END=2548 /DNA_ORIENTATION=+